MDPGKTPGRFVWRGNLWAWFCRKRPASCNVSPRTGRAIKMAPEGLGMDTIYGHLGAGFNLFVNPVFTHIIPFTLAIVINGIVIVIDSHC